MTEETNPNSSAANDEPNAENGAEARLAPEAETAPVDLAAEVERLKNELLYAKAETENVRRRLETQAEERGKYAVANFARDMLQVADNLRRAIEAAAGADGANLAEGVELTERSLLAAFERHGIKRIPALGQPFNPNLHQAMIEIEDPARPAGTVVSELQSGYTIHDRLLREAMVGVSKGGPKLAPGESAPGLDTTA